MYDTKSWIFLILIAFYGCYVFRVYKIPLKERRDMKGKNNESE